jgi:DNA-binding HxlR family transcriptional regulator
VLDYGQFCTVARGAEVLGERWTLLVVRELLCGSTHFNELRRGLPRMSTTLLSTRLRSLEDAGVVHRTVEGRATSYTLTEAGEALRPIVMAIGHWGAEWIGSRLEARHLDAGFLMWDVRRFVRLDLVPAQRRVVVFFHFPDARERERNWWLVVESGTVDLCRDDPGHELTLMVEATVRALTEVWVGDRLPQEVVRTREVRVTGATADRDALWDWLGTSAFAPSRRRALTRQASATRARAPRRPAASTTRP